MQMHEINNSNRIRIFAGSGDGLLLFGGMHWCSIDTKRLCGDLNP